MFKSLLIANRGEIACRIIRTARRLGLRSIAVYSEADREALHAELADEARLIGPAPAAESYLSIDNLIAAARESGAEAVHPGYGFLSENAGFAEAVAAAGLVFVGPPPAAIRAMGSKSEAKAIMGKAGVPLVPGYHGEAQEQERLFKEAERIGYPLLIKASAGGGGKGMRVVERTSDFAAALEGAKREAAGAFGDDRVLLEKYLTRPRHIEVQVFADALGQAIHLFERDCSLQRRHQKVLEEAPAPGLTEARRAAMGAAATAAARAIGYQGAGTVEFISQGEDFFFMEMNTRLQVEHPVTEMVTGLDLVEWQLRIAAGEPLPLKQEEVELKGHAFEARLYAEDPARDYLPATGRIAHLAFPDDGPHVRIDSGVRSGDEITPFYDPMIAKVIAWDRDRATALRRLASALAATEVAGVETNLSLLVSIANHPAFAAAEIDTRFLERHRGTLLHAAGGLEPEILALASLAELLRGAAEAEALAAASGDPFSPWFLSNGWRLNARTQRELNFEEGEASARAVVHYRPDRRGDGYEVEVAGRRLRVEGRPEADGRVLARVEGHQLRFRPVWKGNEITLLLSGRGYRLRLVNPLAPLTAEDAGGGRLVAPMPGKVVAVKAEAGARVARGQPLLVLEAMKMEHTISAPASGRVVAIHYAAGESVEEGAELLAFEAEAEGDPA